jgi:hypothetical protein
MGLFRQAISVLPRALSVQKNCVLLAPVPEKAPQQLPGTSQRRMPTTPQRRLCPRGSGGGGGKGPCVRMRNLPHPARGLAGTAKAAWCQRTRKAAAITPILKNAPVCGHRHHGGRPLPPLRRHLKRGATRRIGHSGKRSHAFRCPRPRQPCGGQTPLRRPA